MTTVRRASWRGPGVLVLVALLFAACSDNSPEPVEQGHPGLPLSDRSALVAHFDPKVAPLGMRVARTALVDTSSRRPSPTGRHLALYVEPTSTWTPDRHVSTLLPLAQALMPDTFARWPALESFDVCQEPSPGVDDRPEPPPVTVLDVTRTGSESIDWDKADLTALFVAALGRPPGLKLRVTQQVSRDPRLTEAESRARAVLGYPPAGGQSPG